MDSLKSVLSRRRFVRDTRGSEVIEFALVLPLLMVVLGGIIDMGFLFNNYQTITNAAREGARIAAVPGRTEEDVIARVNQFLQADGMDTSVVDTHATFALIDLPNGPVNGVKVIVRYPYKYMLLGPLAHLVDPSASFDTVWLAASATMRSEIVAGL